MFGFTDYAEYHRNEQDLDRRTELARRVREQKDAARRLAARQRAARTPQADATRPHPASTRR